MVFAADGIRLGFIRSDDDPRARWARRHPAGHAATPPSRSRTSASTSTAASTARRSCAPRSRTSRPEKTVQGGSTITQQLVRNLYIADPQRTSSARSVEAKLAEESSRSTPSSGSSTEYLNTASYGTWRAARRSASRQPPRSSSRSRQGADLDEAALLAGLPQAPSDYNPFLNPDARCAPQRRPRRDGRAGLHHPGRHDDAVNQGLGLDPGYKYTPIKEPYFFDYVEQELIDRYGVNTVRQAGSRSTPRSTPSSRRRRRRRSMPRLPSRPDGGGVVDRSLDGPHRRDGLVAAATARATSTSRRGTPPARLLVQAVRARDRDEAGNRPRSRPTHRRQPSDPQPARAAADWDGQHRRGSECNGAMTIADGDRGVGQHRLRPARPRRRARNVADNRAQMGIESPLDGLPAEGIGGLRIGVTPLEMADAYSTFATAESTARRPRSSRSSSPTATATSRARTRRSACSPTASPTRRPTSSRP